MMREGRSEARTGGSARPRGRTVTVSAALRGDSPPPRPRAPAHAPQDAATPPAHAHRAPLRLPQSSLRARRRHVRLASPPGEGPLGMRSRSRQPKGGRAGSGLRRVLRVRIPAPAGVRAAARGGGVRAWLAAVCGGAFVRGPGRGAGAHAPRVSGVPPRPGRQERAASPHPEAGAELRGADSPKPSGGAAGELRAPGPALPPAFASRCTSRGGAPTTGDAVRPGVCALTPRVTYDCNNCSNTRYVMLSNF